MTMKLIDASGRLLGKINVIDFGFLATLFLTAVGVMAVQSGWHETSGQMVEGKNDIEYTFLLRNAKSLNPRELFKVGDTLSITIRNQPRGAVKITAVDISPTHVLLPIGNKATLVQDVADPHGYNILITVRDHAIKTADGYVTEGIKVKAGLSAEVEGFAYRYAAYIVDVKAVK